MIADELDDSVYEQLDIKQILRGINREIRELKALRESMMPAEARYVLPITSNSPGHTIPKEEYWASSGTNLDYWPVRQSV